MNKPQLLGLAVAYFGTGVFLYTHASQEWETAPHFESLSAVQRWIVLAFCFWVVVLAWPAFVLVNNINRFLGRRTKK